MVRRGGGKRSRTTAFALSLLLGSSPWSLVNPNNDNHHNNNDNAVEAFTTSTTTFRFGRSSPLAARAPKATFLVVAPRTTRTTTTTTLFAKKKKGGPSAASLDLLDALDDDEPMSLKDQAKAAKKAAKATKKNKAAAPTSDLDFLDDDEPMSKKDQMKAAKKAEKEAKKAAKQQGQQQEQQQQQQQAQQSAPADLDFLDDDEPMSKKDQMKAAKKAEKEAKKAAKDQQQQQEEQQQQTEQSAATNLDFLDDDEPMSKKDQMKAAKKAEQEAKKAAKQQEQEQQQERPKTAAEKAIEQMERDEAATAARAAAEEAEGGGGPKLSKKELKALKKKQEKEDAKAAKRAAKKAGHAATAEEDATPAVDGNEETVGVVAETPEREEITLEERIRKDRPPPRVRVMESSQPGYVALRLEDVSITFRNQEVLKGVTWGVQTGDRIGLVGPNGGGKTTQLRILAGETEPTAGDVVKSSKDLRVSVLRQEFVDELVPERSLKEEFLSVFEDERRILDDLRAAERDLETTDPTDGDKMQTLLDRMQDLQAAADAKDAYNLEGRAKKVMDLMGFTEEEGEARVRMFSGGWKMRIGLGKVLLRDPNVLLLDEPTNHLDLESVEWLEDFLRNQNIPMVIVSHDREFLDQVCTKIVDTAGGIATEYDGNYSNFLKLKKERMDAWQAAYDAQEKKIKSERQWIRKFKLKQPQAVKQREAKLEKLVNSPDYVQKPPFLGKPFRFRFPDAPRISPEVAEVKHLSHAYVTAGTTNTLFDDVDLFIEKNDRIAVLGPNGSGKSTLLRILMGMEEPNGGGSAEIVGQSVVANYFQQNQADALDLDKTVIETVQAASSQQSYNELRALLGQFLFKGDSVEKKVVHLSGGEKARLSLSCMMLRPANLLILDEPTNHLDIPAKEMLEEALQHFQGSVVVISHDRYFISKVATTIVAIEDRKLNKYSGDYKFYMDRSKAVKEKIEARHVKGVERIESAPVIDLDDADQQGKKKSKNFGGAKNANMVTRADKGVKNAKRQRQR